MAPRLIEPKTLIDELLAQQKSLTAVARFAKIHEQDALPAQARYYRDLIPLQAPKPGEQYAFEVDLDQCSGCKACVTACHALNGLDDNETWRSVGLLHGLAQTPHVVPASAGAALQRHVTTACHHCVDPACLNGCPVLAYEKDPITGIVKHLDDQCIGCSYCVLKCPYEVPQYSKARGIVRKCDMCSSRLASGEAPACVQACPNEAIRITLVDREEVSRRFASSTSTSTAAASTLNPFLPDSPAPHYTLPTTKYHSAEPLPSYLRAADHAEIVPAQAHPPLVSFLVLTQMSAGGFLLATLLANTDPKLATLNLLAGLIGLATSVAHLGKPLKAWRAFLGLRRSWLSREIIVFGAFAPLAILLTLTFWLPGPVPLRLQQLLAVSVSLTGISGVLCSVMVYHDTRRKFWSWPGATIKFAGTTLLLGAAALHCFTSSPALTSIIAATAALKILWELTESARSWSAAAPAAAFGRRPLSTFSLDQSGVSSPELTRTAHLLRGPLRLLFHTRLITLIIGGLVFPFVSPIAALLTCLASEFIERHLFFVAVAPDRMPGAPS